MKNHARASLQLVERVHRHHAGIGVEHEHDPADREDDGRATARPDAARPDYIHNGVDACMVRPRMCGIFGVICSSDRAADRLLVRDLAISLLRQSETRGREAVGVAIHDGEQIHVLKQGGSVSDFLAGRQAPRAARPRARDRPGRPLAITGHSRLATNGTQSNDDNNQPVVTHGTVALHNGIIVNDRQLTARYPALAPQGELDSEVLAALLRTKLIASNDLVAATRATFAEIEGSASLAMMFDDLDTMLLATNTGSLFQVSAILESGASLTMFASERFILQRVIEDRATSARLGDVRLEQIRAGHALAVSLDGKTRHAFQLSGPDDSESRTDRAQRPHTSRSSITARGSIGSSAAPAASSPRPTRSSASMTTGCAATVATGSGSGPKASRR